MAPRIKGGDEIASFNGKWISWSHTAVAYTAFLGALIVGSALHYRKIVENEHFGYPEEWFPSVSATIGDRYPERSVFQLFIAITSGPRFALVALWYILSSRAHPNSSFPKFLVGVGLFRTVACGGWTYITSTDDHGWHDIFMISYLVATVPWTLGCLSLSPPNPQAIKWRKRFGGTFFATLIPLMYFFIQHKIHKVPGAYTTYAFFEWALVLLDVAFDATTVYDFEGLEIVLRDVKGITRGYVPWLPNDGYMPGAGVEKDKNRETSEILSSNPSLSTILDTLANVYNGFIFWTTLTSLGLSVWYFPLWNMGLSGYEVLVMTTTSPFLLAIPSFRRFVFKYNTIFHLLTLSGVAAYLVVSPVLRLFTVGFAVAMGCLAWTAALYVERSQPYRLEARVLSLSLGLILSSVAKFAFRTNNPIWPIMHSENGGWNGVGLALGVLAALRSARQTNASGSDISPAVLKSSPTLTALGLSGAFFAMHSLLSDSSTMILWVWTGWPAKGPLAVPHGVLTLMSMGLGVLIGLYYPAVSRSWAFYAVGATGAFALTAMENWSGFCGALALATYVPAVFPSLISSAVTHSPAKVFGVGFLIYNILVLAHVWIVAYAFVPGGPLMREHTDYVMSAMMLFIGCGVYASQSSAPGFGSKGKSRVASPMNRRQRSYYLYALLGIQLLAVSVGYLRFPLYNYKPYHADEKVITAGIWTVHFSLDNDMWSSEHLMRDAIRDMELDVVGLLESDLQRIIMGNRDTTQFLAEDLGMYVDYGPGPNKHTWGAALLSKFPIVNSTHHLLPSPVGELAPAIHATINAYDQLVDVFVFHSGQEEDPEDRRLQSEYLANLMGTVKNRPAILLSYLVTRPKEGNYNTYVSETSGMKDIDPSDSDRWCEYILYKGLKRSGFARLSRGKITDTELQAGKFVVGKPEGGDQHIPESDVPVGLRFPSLFKGEGVRGHRYHVFDEPRYFA